MENHKIIDEQFERYVSGDMDPSEVHTFLTQLTTTYDETEVKDMLLTFMEKSEQNVRVISEEWKQVLDESLVDVKSRIAMESVARKKTTWHMYLRIAATISIIFSLGYWVIDNYFDSKNVQKEVVTNKNIKPGKTAATLTLSNGQTIVLDENFTGELAAEQGVQIIMQSDGQIIYKLTESVASETLKYNQLSTARGESYQLQLPDGTKVWLNAQSSILYPTNINKQTSRKIELSGEAYFEVSKTEDKTFEVETQRGTVQVLGTHFNVSDYADDNSAHITLVEGKVKVLNTAQESKILSPNQQLKIQSDMMFVRNVDVSEVIAWKNGEYMFDQLTLIEIMKNLSRWYDIDVDIDPSLRDMRIWGSISRSDELDKVLQIIRLTDKDIRVEIDGRRVKLMK